MLGRILVFLQVFLELMFDLFFEHVTDPELIMLIDFIVVIDWSSKIRNILLASIVQLL